jgi:hypothetical protein
MTQQTTTLPRAGRPPTINMAYEKPGKDIYSTRVKGEEFRFRVVYGEAGQPSRVYPLGSREKRQSPNFDYAYTLVKQEANLY